MPFECEECGLTKIDEEKKEVIDGITVKNVCNDCFDPQKHIVLSKFSEEEIKERMQEVYRPKKIEKQEIMQRKIGDDFRRRLRMERIKKGLTIAQLAELLQINASQLEKFEKGIIEDLYIRKKVIDFFGIKLALEKFKKSDAVEEGIKIDFRSNIKLSQIIENGSKDNQE